MSRAPDAAAAPPGPDDAYSKQLGHLNALLADGGSFSGNERNCAFVNVNGTRFATASSALGFDFLDDARSIGMLDWDWDGRMDAWVANRTAPRLRLLANRLAAGSWLKVKLAGTTANRDAVGARLELQLEDGRRLLRSVRAGEGFLSQSSKWVHFGLGAPEARIQSLAVTWPGTKARQLIRNVEPQRHYVITQGDPEAREFEPPSPAMALQGRPGSRETAPETSEPPQLLLSYRPKLPPVTYEDPGGKRRTLQQEFGDKAVLVNLWASWCAPCRDELRDFARAAGRMSNAGLQVLPLASDFEPDPAAERAILKAAGVSFPTGRVTAETREMFESVFRNVLSAKRELPAPASFLIDADGRLVAIYAGVVTPERVLGDLAMLEREQGATASTGNWLHPPQGANYLFLALGLMQHDRVEEALECARANHDLIKVHKDYPKFLVWVGDAMIRAGRINDALTAYLNALNLDPDDPVVMNNVAWQMATHPSAAVRNGAEALKWAKLAAEKTRFEDATYLDTLAAAHAENGDFRSAIDTATRALQLATRANQRELLPGLQKALQLYRAGRPFR